MYVRNPDNPSACRISTAENRMLTGVTLLPDRNFRLHSTLPPPRIRFDHERSRRCWKSRRCYRFDSRYENSVRSILSTKCRFHDHERRMPTCHFTLLRSRTGRHWKRRQNYLKLFTYIYHQKCRCTIADILNSHSKMPKFNSISISGYHMQVSYSH
jgi:hypothetical protein